MEVDVYARISDDQTGEARGVEAQLAECRAHAEVRGWEVVDVFRDDSISATKGRRRPGFEALLDRPVRRPVLVWHIDRLQRTMRDLERLLDQDLEIHGVQGDRLDLSTPDGRMTARIVTSVSQREGEHKAARQKVANKALAAKGVPMWRQAPFGHTAKGAIVPEEAAVVREAAERVLAGESARSVRRWLQALPGAPDTNVNRFLSNPRLAGHNYYLGERTAESQIEPILDEATFSDLAALLGDPARRTSGARGKVTSLLTSIARCGVCGDGTTLRTVTEVKKGDRHAMYRCRAVSHNPHPRPTVDIEVVTATLDLLESDEAPEIVERHSRAPEGVRDRLADLRGRLAEWQEVGSTLPPVEYMRVTRPVREELAALEDQMRRSSHRSVFEGLEAPADASMRQWYDNRRELISRFDGLPLLKRREIVSTLWTVTLHPRPRTGPKGRYAPRAGTVELVRK